MNKSNKGFTLVELLVVIGILGILMGALFPAISAAMLNAQTSAMGSRGRNLFTAIIQANTEREQHSRPQVWPKDNTDGMNDEDTRLCGATSATKYFEELFDIQHKNDSKTWDPVVSCDLNVLSGSGVAGVSGTTLTKENVAWCIAANVDEVTENVPVLASRNVNVQSINSKLAGSVQGNETEKIGCGKAGQSQWDTPFANKAWVLVRKGGSVATIKTKYSTIATIFDNQSYDSSGAEDAPKLLAVE